MLFSQTKPKGFTAKTLKTEVCDLIESLCKDLEEMHRHLLGIGIGFSGVIDAENQIIYRSVSLDFQEPFDFQKEIASHFFSFPVILENDANCGAWGEVVFQRKQKKLKNFLFVLIEFWKRYEVQAASAQPTIGLGFGFDGKKIYRGSSSQAGEFKSVCNRDSTSLQQVQIAQGVSVSEDGRPYAIISRKYARTWHFLSIHWISGMYSSGEQ